MEEKNEKVPEKCLDDMTIKRGMGFAGALELLLAGKKVTRTGWNNWEFPYLKLLTDDTIMMACVKYVSLRKRHEFLGWNHWVPKPSDFVMDDWVKVK